MNVKHPYSSLLRRKNDEIESDVISESPAVSFKKNSDYKKILTISVSSVLMTLVVESINQWFQTSPDSTATPLEFSGDVLMVRHNLSWWMGFLSRSHLTL